MVAFDPGGIGRWTDELKFAVTAERIAEYARATNDPIERHLSGDVAPPVFAIVPVFEALIPAALSVAPVELVLKIVHGEQDFRFHRPIRPGMALVSRARPIGYRGRSSGTRSTVHVETRDDAGLVAEQWITLFYRGHDAGDLVGSLADPLGFDESARAAGPVATVTQHIDEDQTFRYGPASGDLTPIHMDDDVARSVGLPGIIVHGLCTLAFTSWAILTELAGGRVERLKRLAVRFSKPVLPGQDIRTDIYRGASYHFETSADGVLVLKDGLAEVEDH